VTLSKQVYEGWRDGWPNSAPRSSSGELRLSTLTSRPCDRRHTRCVTVVPETDGVPSGSRRVGMDENYRVLGREREADFAREAASRRLAAEARQGGPKPKCVSHNQERRPRLVALRARMALLLAPARRHEAEARDAL
jgi:hypothetical protein